MSIPNRSGKYGDKAVIEPEIVIRERMKSGIHPSFEVPAGAVICYDSSLWQWINTIPGKIECDGWLKGSLLLTHGDSRILVSRAAGYGAPTAVMTLEELIAFGIGKFVNLGTAGGLQPDMNVGDIVVCERAIRDEGTSHHYIPGEKYAYACKNLTEQLVTAVSEKGISYRTGTSWTTDAPYRETLDELKAYRSEGVATVEMEASALFAVGAFRGASVSSVFAVSDILKEEGWNQGYHSEEKNQGLRHIFMVAVELLANSSKKRPAGVNYFY